MGAWQVTRVLLNRTDRPGYAYSWGYTDPLVMARIVSSSSSYSAALAVSGR